jgi:hypothetical protein
MHERIIERREDMRDTEDVFTLKRSKRLNAKQLKDSTSRACGPRLSAGASSFGAFPLRAAILLLVLV